MQLNNYRFGYVETNGTSHQNDLIVHGDWVKSNWWRQDGHSLVPEDLEDLIPRKPDRLIVGKGASGRMTIPASTRKAIENEGISLEAYKTEQAINEYNRRQDSSESVAGAFHLTC